MIRAAGIVARKELRVIFRDRQTVIYAVVLPLVMYPALFWVMLQVMALVEGKRAAATVEVAVAAEDGAEDRLAELVDALGLGLPDDLALGLPAAPVEAAPVDGPPDGSAGDGPAGEGPAEEADGEAAEESATGRLVRVALGPDRTGREDLEASLSEEADPTPDVALWVPRAPAPLEILFDGARARSSNGAERVGAELAALREELRAAAVADLALDPRELSAVRYRPVNLSSSKEIGAFVVSMMLPMMIVLMAVMGAFYPAVDLTAGERERRTEETTLLAPVDRLAVQLGKLAAVATTSAVASGVNLLGMGLAAGHLLGMLGGGKVGFELDWVDVLLVVPLALPLVVFVAAALTGVASLAETFKQGQSMLGAVQMVFIFPAIASSLPGLELTPGIACLPVVGISVAFRTVLRGGPLAELPWDGLALAAAALLVYAALAVWVSVRLMGRELETGGAPDLAGRLRAAFRR